MVLCSLTINFLFLILHAPNGQDYHSLLFGSGRNVNSLATNVSSSLCLPISIQEVLDMNQSLQTDSVEVNSHSLLYCLVTIDLLDVSLW